MYKVLLSVVVYLFLGCAISTHSPKWISQDAKVISHHDKILDTVKLTQQTAIKQYRGQVDFEYTIEERVEGYIVSVNPLYLQENGEYTVLLDGEECIYIKKSFQVVKSIQCMAVYTPPF